MCSLVRSAMPNRPSSAVLEPRNQLIKFAAELDRGDGAQAIFQSLGAGFGSMPASQRDTDKHRSIQLDIAPSIHNAEAAPRRE
jgi:hypothetical protein